DFQGVVYPVNPHAQAIRGVRSYPSVQEIPDPLDLAIIIVPAASVRAVLEECGRKGVRGVVVISAGFRESGPQGRHRAAERVAAEPRTDHIRWYLSELADGQRFIGLCREISGEIAQPKPILAVKSGRTPAGARAVSSHTGSLAGSDEVYDAVFLQSGVLRVDS